MELGGNEERGRQVGDRTPNPIPTNPLSLGSRKILFELQLIALV